MRHRRDPLARNTLAANEVTIWLQDTSVLVNDELQAMDAILSDEERARRDRFVFEHDRRDFTAAHALLRSTLSRSGELRPSEWRFASDRYVKPSLVPEQFADFAIAFNLSHTKGLVACAVARNTRIGVDIERINRLTNATETAKRYFTPSEIELLGRVHGSEVDTRFVELWTLKESYMKAVGMGLTLPLDSFGFSFGGDAGLAFISDDTSCWHFWLAAVSTTARLAVAVCGDEPRGAWQISYRNANQSLEPSVTPLHSTET